MTNRYGLQPKYGPSRLLLWAVCEKHRKGTPCKTIADAIGVSPKTICAWVKRCRDGKA